MATMTKTINGNEYTFYNNWRGNRSGFVHETELYKNGRFMGRNKIQYYNRTWESYDFQSVMIGVVRELLDDCRKSFESSWKNARNIKRLTEAKRQEMTAEFEGNLPEDYVEFYELYSML